MARHHKSAKRKHQSMRDRMHEREGEMRHMERMGEDRLHEREGVEYAMDRRADGIENGRSGGRAMYEPSERAMERRSGMMLTEDHRAIANMPQRVVYEEWGRERPYLRTNLDDTMSGIDMQQSEDVGMANRHKAKSMY